MVFIDDILAAEDAFEPPPMLLELVPVLPLLLVGIVLLLLLPFGMLRLPDRR